MTNTPSPSPAEIAAKLTKAERELVGKTWTSGYGDPQSWTGFDLRDAGLADCRPVTHGNWGRNYFTPTPLGCAVRAILQQEQSQ